jgi:predicted metallopeptidase
LSAKEERNLDADPLALNEEMFKVYVVQEILSKETEKAVELVCKKNRITAPSLRIGGVPKGHKKALGVYSVESNSIAFRDQDQFFNPFVVLHELYHCIRSKSGSHRGTEKNADRFALSFIDTYNKFAKSVSEKIPSQALDVD